ncbi:hypothetical protein G3M53_94700 [Streptomyces sp. SID7982]|uniref:WXG100 family type VII secretion target n=1 Tax=Streptomyces pakalii TaxID=3036494 RepID=A0ABT7DAM2_9ACTN|nr:hypothetical protein [Streptomyces pakalii]MDJ1642758.1 hypothetical protein [Streptomyces pakalii]NEE42188.1 hypothetical protein [Streptomyces sp. SID7982]
MSEDGTFHLEPDRVQQGKALLAELGSYSWGLAAEFDSIMGDTSWCGGDENGRKIEANFTSNRDSVSAALNGLGEVLERTCDAVLLNLNATSSTQDEIVDEIDAQAGGYSVGGDVPGGGRRG